MRKIDFNRDWTVQKEGQERVEHVNLPHDAMLYEKRAKENKTASASAYFEGGKYIYKKIWDVDAQTAEQTNILEFEGVYQNARISLNGNQIAERPYGYTNFYVDLTDLLTVGQNEIQVIADNADVPNSRWYSGSGIYRPVSLYTAGSSYIKPEGIKVQVLDQECICLRLACVAENAQAKITILDQNAVVTDMVVEDLTHLETEGITIMIPNAKPWSAEDPHLYRVRAELVQDGSVLDCDESHFGMRTLAWGKEGFLVNGKEVLFRGACIHHDNGVLGACGFADAETRRVRILKEAGFNAIRSAHNPISKAMLDACDVMGMYVMDETFDMWMIHKNPYDYAGDKFKEWWKADTQAMISKDYNHPSVVMYSIGNEITELGMEDGQKQAKVMVDFCHEKDKTRPVTAGINLMLAMMAGGKKSIYGTDDKGQVKDSGTGGMDAMPTSDFFNLLMNKMGKLMTKAASSKKANAVAVKMREIFDIPGYNYATSRYEKDARDCPNQATTGSETLPQSLYENWQLVKKLPTMTGDFMWTGWDYLGESGIGTVRYVDKKTKENIDPGLIMTGGPGIIDICGKMRPEVGWGKIIWGLQDVPTIGVDPLTHADHFQSLSMWRTTDAVESWSWEGCEGKRTMATVYSDAPVVELLVNGQSLGKKKTKQDMAKFKKVTYQEGQIEAVAYDASGKETGRSKLVSASGKTKISLRPECQSLRANGQDLCFLNIDLVGENGITKSSVDQVLKVEVTGAGCLQGYGSARPNIADDFVSDQHKTFLGKSLAVIRAGYETGCIHVKVSGEGLEPVETDISVS